MKSEKDSLNNKWEKAKIESLILMAESRLKMAINMASSKHYLDLPLNDFENQELRTEAFRRFESLAEANGYQISGSYKNEYWRISIVKLSKSRTLEQPTNFGSTKDGDFVSQKPVPELEVRLSTTFWGVAFMFFLSCGLGLAYILLTTAGSEFSAWVLVAGLLLGAAFSLTKVQDRNPKLVINHLGIFWSKWQCNLIPWEDIDSIGYRYRSKRQGHQGLNVEVILKDPAKYHYRLLQFPARRLDQTGDHNAPIILDLSGYDIDIKKLWQFITSIDSAKKKVERGKRWRDESYAWLLS